jgi:Outer membrane protein beta-barrel domain
MKNLLTKVSKSLVGAAALTVAVFASGQVAAQRAELGAKKSTFMVGVKGGFSLTEFRTTGDRDFWATNRGAIKIGGVQGLAFARYNATNWGYVELEAGYSLSGANWNGQGRGGINTIRLHNIQTNLLFGIKLPVLSVYEPKVFFGPSFDFNFHASDRYVGPALNGGTSTVYTMRDVTNNFKAMDIGFIFGTQVEFDVKFANLLVDIRYRHGLTQMNNNRTTSNMLGGRAINSAGLSLMLGLGFPL